MGHGPRQSRQTVVVGNSGLGEGQAGATLLFERVGVKIAAMRCYMGGRQLEGKSDRDCLLPGPRELYCYIQCC
eukprot:361928-Chlamydomonas_euryale.AAC.2